VSENTKRETFCPRCDRTVPAIEPWRWWGALWNVWKVGFVIVLVCFPIMAADYCVMLPSMMLYMVGGGLLRGYAREKPVCTRCSLELDAIRPRKAT